jgi:hypothetical protein
VPYPVIISQSSDLANGTTTVKADGGNMIAVKGCEYAMCVGDEPGTAGGVVSSTFKKEAKFILFSFDVKMDGKNVCRQTDKMTMNHQNTVCLGGTFPTCCTASEFPLEGIDCDEKKKNPPTAPPWTECMCKEVCAKVKAFNRRKKKKKTRITPSPSRPASPQNKAYNAGKERFIANFEAAVKKHGANSRKVQKMFTHKCRHDEWLASGGNLPIDQGRSNTGMNPDHVHDAGLGGSLGVRNLKWMNSRANQTIGPAMQNFDDTKHKTIRANPNCKCR